MRQISNPLKLFAIFSGTAEKTANNFRGLLIAAHGTLGSAQCLRLSERFFIYPLQVTSFIMITLV